VSEHVDDGLDGHRGEEGFEEVVTQQGQLSMLDVVHVSFVVDYWDAISLGGFDTKD
jgi:hypothetical protein